MYLPLFYCSLFCPTECTVHLGYTSLHGSLWSEVLVLERTCSSPMMNTLCISLLPILLDSFVWLMNQSSVSWCMTKKGQLKVEPNTISCCTFVTLCVHLTCTARWIILYFHTDIYFYYKILVLFPLDPLNNLCSDENYNNYRQLIIPWSLIDYHFYSNVFHMYVEFIIMPCSVR